jgi:hypothetical protein
MSLRDQILGSKPLTEAVPLPELGDGIEQTVRGMTGSERDAFEASLMEGRGKRRQVSMKNVRAKLVAFCCIEPDGQHTFTEADVEQLGGVRGDLVDRLFTVAQRLSGMSKEDVDELGSSSPKSSGTSSSPSPAN